MRQTLRILIRLSLVPGLLGLAVTLPTAPAPAQETFLIPRDDGYGIAECLNAGSSCARTVADAWCAAMGRGPSISFGAVDGEAATIERIAASRKNSGFRVTCG